MEVLKILSEFRREISSHDEAKNIYLRIALQLKKIYKCDIFFIYLLNKTNKYELKFFTPKQNNFLLRKNIAKSQVWLENDNSEQLCALHDDLFEKIPTSNSPSIQLITAALKNHSRIFGIIGMVNFYSKGKKMKEIGSNPEKALFLELAELSSMVITAKKRTDKLNFVLDTFEKVREKKTKKEVFQLLANRLTGKESKFNACIIHLVDGQRNNLYGYVSSGIKYKLKTSSRVIIGETVIGKVFEDGNTRISLTSSIDFPYSSWADKNGFISMIVVQLKDISNRRFGTLSLFTSYQYIEEELDRQFLDNFLKQTSIVIDSILHEERINKLSSVDEIISDIIPFEKSLEDLLKIFLKKTLQQLKADLGYVSLLAKHTENIVPSYKLDISGKFKDFDLPNTLTLKNPTSISESVISNNKGYLFPSDPEIDLRFVNYSNTTNTKIESELLIPLIYEAKAIGLMVVSSTHKHMFDIYDLEFLEKTAQKAAQVIQSKIFYEASKSLNEKKFEHLDEEDICSDTADITTKVLGTPVCCVWLIDQKDENILRLRGWSGCTITETERMTPIGKEKISKSWMVIQEAILKKGEQIVRSFADIDNESNGFLHKEFAEKNGLKSMISIPIIHNNKVLGVINTYTRRKYELLTTELLLLKNIAIRCADAISNANLHEKNVVLRDKWASTNVIANPGTVALTFVHDITHQLQYLNNDLNLLDSFIPHTIKNYDDINSILESITKHSTSLSKTFASFIRIGKQVKQKKTFTNLELIVKDVGHLFENRFKANKIIFSSSFEGNVSINCYANEIEQSLVNMILNSISALDKVTHRKREIKVHVGPALLDNKPHMKIEVYDNGNGIKNSGENIYDSTFSTKGEDGSGFGLSICKRIVEDNHGGKIYHQSSVNEYTFFYIYLPILNNPSNRL